MIKHGLSEEEARKHIWLVDSKGLVAKNRPEGGINHEKAPFAKSCSPLKNLSEIIDFVKPTAIIGEYIPQIYNKKLHALFYET